MVCTAQLEPSQRNPTTPDAWDLSLGSCSVFLTYMCRFAIGPMSTLSPMQLVPVSVWVRYVVGSAG